MTAVGRLLRMLLVTAGPVEAEADDDFAAADDDEPDDSVTNTPPPGTPPALVDDDFPKSLGKSVVTPMNPGIV